MKYGSGVASLQTLEAVTVAQHPPRRRHRQTWWLVLVSALVVLGSCATWLIIHGRWELTHDLPNPYWAIFQRDYTYQADVGPPAPGLVDTSPEQVIRTYVQDYITIAGTFPCVDDLAEYAMPQILHYHDPILTQQPCTVHRPVEAIHLGEVRYRPRGGYLPPMYVQLDISYTSGGQFHTTVEIEPDTIQHYYFSYIHLDFWTNADINLFYLLYLVRTPDPRLQVPKGVSFPPDKSIGPCKL